MKLGVLTQPTVIGCVPEEQTSGVLVVPILSWHHQSFDTEPAITNWGGIPKIHEAMVDYTACVWPGLNMHSEEVAAHIDAMNLPVDQVLQMTKGGAIPVVSFSHFVPRIETYT
uniref:Uncharacterized protein n=1 Tax=Ditylum brightwellii TaxID=49249 RepID=A0A7S4QL89_9STRA|mmetsp:Transcript_45437/g.68566  ORF Transcript_45437/g.68566 Transcript_45437/m.68566 type:complete len:113 (+) Transcript_45437:90-428(+)